MSIEDNWDCYVNYQHSAQPPKVFYDRSLRKVYRSAALGMCRMMLLLNHATESKDLHITSTQDFVGAFWRLLDLSLPGVHWKCPHLRLFRGSTKQSCILISSPFLCSCRWRRQDTIVQQWLPHNRRPGQGEWNYVRRAKSRIYSVRSI